MGKKGPIFIVGCPRSGTTMLRFSLNRHSNIFIYGESNFFRNVYGNRFIFKDLNDIKNISLLLDKFFKSEDPTIKKYEKLKNYFKNKILKECDQHRNILEIILGELARREGKVRWGEKTPTHYLYLKQIFNLYPNSKVIFIKRDPRSVVASYLRRDNLPESYFGIILLYLESIKKIEKYSKKIYTVKYEDILVDPEKEFRNICDYIGEKFEYDLLKPGVDNSSGNQSYFKETGKYTITDNSIGIKKNKKEYWKNELNKEALDFINRKIINKKIRWDKKEFEYIIKKSKFKIGFWKSYFGLESLF